MLFRSAASSGAVSTAEVAIPEEIPEFRPGMSGTVDVYTDHVAECVTVPIQSITVRDYNRLSDSEEESEDSDSEEATASILEEEDLRQIVFVVKDGEAAMVEVETGISDDTRIEVKSGLSGGETVVIGPYSVVSRTLKEGAKVRKGEERGDHEEAE